MLRSLSIVAFSAILAGCGTASQGEAPPGDPNEIALESSPASHSELGVYRWGTNRFDVDSSVKGYDAASNVVLELRRGAADGVVHYVLKHGDEVGRVAIATREPDDMAVLESTVTPKLARAAELVAQDFRALSRAKAANGMTAKTAGALSPSTLRPLGPNDSLVVDCASLVAQCDEDRGQLVSDTAGAYRDCRPPEATDPAAVGCDRPWYYGLWFSEERCLEDVWMACRAAHSEAETTRMRGSSSKCDQTQLSSDYNRCWASKPPPAYQWPDE